MNIVCCDQCNAIIKLKRIEDLEKLVQDMWCFIGSIPLENIPNNCFPLINGLHFCNEMERLGIKYKEESEVWLND